MLCTIRNDIYKNNKTADTIKNRNEMIRIPFDNLRVGLLVYEDECMTIDFSALLLSEKSKIVDDDYFVFYNSRCRLSSDKSKVLKLNSGGHKSGLYSCDPEVSVVGSCGNCFGDCENENDVADEDDYLDWFDVDLKIINNDVKKILFVVSAYPHAPRSFFGGHTKLFIDVLADDRLFCEFCLDSFVDYCSAIESISLIRLENEWWIKSVGHGFPGGLEEVIDKYC